MTSRLLVTSGWIEVGMDENSRNRSEHATTRRCNHVKVSGCDSEPEGINQLTLEIKNALCTRENL